jgi:hypothetical protein
VTASTYAAIRKGGNFGALETNIELFLKRRCALGSETPLLRLSFLLLPLNSHELPAFLKRWEGVADMISIQKPVSYEGTIIPAREKNPEPVNCAQPWQRLGVLEDGSLWPCCSFHGKDFLRHLNATMGISAIWQGEGMGTLREKLVSGIPPAACKLCFASID